MRVFVAVAEHNGFSAAAKALSLSTTGVTRHIAALEARLGTRLLHRTTRRISLTTAGTAYYQRCLDLLADFDDAEASVRAQAVQPSGTLRVNAPVSFGIARLGPVLAAYRQQYPAVTLDLTLSDRVSDLVEEGFDLAIRITRQPAPNLIARRLADAQLLLCASPAYLSRAGTPRHPHDLADHQCLAYSYWADGNVWKLRGPDGEIAVEIGGGLRANNGDLLRQAALDGMGIVLQPDFLVGDDVASGRLVPVLPAYGLPSIGIYAVYASRSHLAPKVRSFIDHLVESLRS